MFRIRPANINDLKDITEIYNDAILKTTATFDTNPKTDDEQRGWFSAHGETHPVLVAIENEKVAGWASLSKWSDRCAYDYTAEVSFYVKEEYRNKGIGKKLLEVITMQGQKSGLRSIISRIAEGNIVSINLHEALGYGHIGIMRQVGKKFGKYWDVYLMQKLFPAEEK